MFYSATSSYLGRTRATVELSVLGLMSEGCGKFTGWEGNSLQREDEAVNRIHYLHSAQLAGLSPPVDDGKGRSYLKEADNPKDPQSRDPHCPARWTDSTFNPPHTPSHLSLWAQTKQICGVYVELYSFKGSCRSLKVLKTALESLV